MSLNPGNIDFDKIMLDGADIRFLDADGTTELAYEIEAWDDGAETATVWVKVPKIDLNSTTDHIWIYYNNAGETHDQDPEGVWSSGYAGVWHLNEASGTRADSTSGNNDLTDNNTVASAAGKFGNAADLERSNSEKLTITDAAQTGLDPVGNLITFGAWVKPESVGSTAGIFDKESGSGDGYRLRMNGSSVFEHGVFGTFTPTGRRPRPSG